jgi:hypothetical protein
MDYTLSRYITRLQHLLDRHGDMPVRTATGKECCLIAKPIVRRAQRSHENYSTFISDKGSSMVCIIHEDPEIGHPYYRSMSTPDTY